MPDVRHRRRPVCVWIPYTVGDAPIPIGEVDDLKHRAMAIENRTHHNHSEPPREPPFWKRPLDEPKHLRWTRCLHPSNDAACAFAWTRRRVARSPDCCIPWWLSHKGVAAPGLCARIASW